jgi:hypothetical protein
MQIPQDPHVSERAGAIAAGTAWQGLVLGRFSGSDDESGVAILPQESSHWQKNEWRVFY